MVWLSGDQEPRSSLGEVYQSVQKVMDAIDEAALVLTGKRDHFWLKPHAATSYTSRAAPENGSGE